MSQARGPRISGWLPRGGLGFLGFVPSAAAVLCALWADARVAIPVTSVSLFVSAWCAAGLRRDDEAEEVADRYTARDRGLRLVDILSGQWESERRFSSDMIFCSVIGLAIGILRYLFDWGPLT